MATFLKKLFFISMQSMFICALGQTKHIQQPINSSSIFTNFNTFFEKEIKHQGIKCDWLFKLNEITGNHTFDYNNDGFSDVLIEFNAVPIDGGGVTYYFAVLFKNQLNNNFNYVSYVETDNLVFKQYADGVFLFNHTKKHSNVTFSIINSVFSKNI